MEHFRGALDVHDFTDIAVHLAQTPESFYSANPILYHRALSASLVISLADLDFAPLLQPYAGLPIPNGHGSATAEDESAPERNREITVSGVDIWVTSENLQLHFTSHDGGVTIPYPAISLHAVQRSMEPSTPASVYLQILKELGPYDDHDPDSTFSITLIPAPSTAPLSSPPAPDAPLSSTPGDEPATPVQRLFTALTECANLHPDPASDSGSDAGRLPAIAFEGDAQALDAGNQYSSGLALPPPMPGSGGWITAENVGDFYPDEGTPDDVQNSAYVRSSADAPALGEGAGSVRAREEEDEGGQVNGDETKWRRTE